ncbi:hypothetical protein L198_00030 [Cryptococcus wingfieldii CBS 7118]|uniref:F-box domain-containing protein n=1 Tax=Cryptococcus wingfieldii CBS 7118 TaxID=1295528 RepID=A0A1E3K6Z4_9TREE|nr:hypothetical protein L198_00030 [Cryptococcus wingfieldii CBS 7118]ODO08307.1 hypothetical protein L198_00030 [Cryptococcus wingfieldii CBS 7118]
MPSASQVARTTDILHIIFSHISAGNDLTSLLRTSPLFFGLIAPKLYRSLPISNVLNSFLGVNAGGRGGPYGKTKLLELVQTVVVERARPPVDHPVWADWYEYPALLAVKTVIIHPADRITRQEGGQDTTLPNNAVIERLCPTATRLHLSIPCYNYTAGADCIQSMPSLPCVETLVVKANAGKIMKLEHVVGKLNYRVWKYGQTKRPPCPNIKAVHILLWGDFLYPEEELQRSYFDLDWPDLSMKVTLKDKIFHNLCGIAVRLGTRFSIDELCLYNADTVLERLSKLTKSRKVDDMKAEVEREFKEEMKTSAEVLCMPEEAAKAQVYWRTGQEFYEAFGDMSARDEKEEWYHWAFAPSPNLVSVRAGLAAKTDFPADAFVGLTEGEAEWMLAVF